MPGLDTALVLRSAGERGRILITAWPRLRPARDRPRPGPGLRPVPRCAALPDQLSSPARTPCVRHLDNLSRCWITDRCGTEPLHTARRHEAVGLGRRVHALFASVLTNAPSHWRRTACGRIRAESRSGCCQAARPWLRRAARSSLLTPGAKSDIHRKSSPDEQRVLLRASRITHRAIVKRW